MRGGNDLVFGQISPISPPPLQVKSNKLSVNIKKTNYVIFKPKQKSVHMISEISFDSIALKQETEVLRYLY